jgi:hypothetical protein
MRRKKTTTLLTETKHLTHNEKRKEEDRPSISFDIDGDPDTSPTTTG